MGLPVRASSARHEACGARLKSVKKDIAFKIESPVDNIKKGGCCLLAFNEECILSQITHLSGCTVHADKYNRCISKDAVVRDNHSDCLAAFITPHFPPLQMLKLCRDQKDAGPNKYFAVKGGACRTLNTLVREIEMKMNEEKNCLVRVVA